MQNKPRLVACPQCKKDAVFSPENLYRPFCSERCKMIDLGAWANEEHKISEPIDMNDLDEDLDTPSIN